MLARHVATEQTCHELVTTQHTTDTSSVEGQVEFPKGWYTLPPEVSQHIEIQYASGSRECSYAECKSKKQNLFRHYIIDVKTMYQRNVASVRLRKVRRIQKPLVVQQSAPSSIEPEGVWRDPPLPSEGTTSSSMSFDAVRDANSHDKPPKNKKKMPSVDESTPSVLAAVLGVDKQLDNSAEQPA